ncbi:MAG TPA: hypothetical protein VF013_03415 [Candidatus Limnocylindria bacterium]
MVADTLAAALTFFLPDVLLGPAVMNGSARGTALIMLVLAAPMLVVGLALAGRGSRWAAVLTAGALAYLLYNDVMLLFATPFNRLFLLYVAAFSLTGFAFGATLLKADAEAVAERLPKTTSRILGGYVWAIVLFNTLAWLRTIVPAIGADDPTSFLDGMGIATNPVFVQDLSFWLPSAAVVGWLLWTRRRWGVLLGGAYLLYGLMESIGVAVDQWFGTTADPASTIATMGGAYLFAVLAVIGLVPLALYVRGRSHATWTAQGVPRPA